MVDKTPFCVNVNNNREEYMIEGITTIVITTIIGGIIIGQELPKAGDKEKGRTNIMTPGAWGGVYIIVAGLFISFFAFAG